MSSPNSISSVQIERLRQVVTGVTKILTNNNIKVTQVGASAYVKADASGKPVLINIPYIPDNATEELILAIQGFVDHEVAHALYTDYNSLNRKGVDKKYANIIEDPRIEREIKARFPGSEENINKLHNFFLDKITKPALQESFGDDMKMFNNLLVPAIRAMSGQKMFQEFMNNGDYWNNQYIKKIVDNLPEKTKELLKNSKSTQDSIDIANKILEILQSDPPPPEDGDDGDDSDENKDEKNKKKDKNKKNKNKDKNKDDNEDKKDKEKKKDKNKDKSEEEKKKDKNKNKNGDEEDSDESDDEDEDGDSDEGDSDEDNDGEDEGDSDESGDKDKSDSDGDPSDSDDESDGEGDDEGDDGDYDDDDDDSDQLASEDREGREEKENAPHGSAKDFTQVKNFDENLSNFIHKKSVEIGDASSYRVYTTDYDFFGRLTIPSNYPSHKIRDLDDRVQRLVGPMSKNLERLVASKSLVKRTPGYRKGKLHSSGLYKIATGDDRLFRKNEEAKSLETAITLLCDNSGSMSNNNKIQTAMEAAYAMSSVLERIKVKHSILGFTDSAGSVYGRESESVHMKNMPRDYLSQVAAEEKKNGFKYDRIYPIVNVLYKDFSDRLTPTVKQSLAFARTDADFLSSNVDGESLDFAAKLLLKRPEKRKILIVFSDGQPAFSSNSMYSRGDVGRAHLIEMVKKAEKSGIEVIGIGICTDAVKYYYTKNMVIRNVSELPKIIITELKKALL